MFEIFLKDIPEPRKNLEFQKTTSNFLISKNQKEILLLLWIKIIKLEN